MSEIFSVVSENSWAATC